MKQSIDEEILLPKIYKWSRVLLFGVVVNKMSEAIASLLTMEAEYIEATHSSKEVVWLKSLCLEDVFYKNNL